MNNNIQLKKTLTSCVSKNFRRRAVAPVIATLLLVAIAVVGGSIIFVFSQGFFATAQISDSPQIESIKILGYDATDGEFSQAHDGFESGIATGNAISNGLKANEYIFIYVKNDSVNEVTFSEIRLAGDVYTYVDFGANSIPDWSSTNLLESEYGIIAVGDGTTNEYETIDSSAPELQPGQEATIIMELEKDVKTGRDMQFKLSTANGAIFVSTILSGQQNG